VGRNFNAGPLTELTSVPINVMDCGLPDALSAKMSAACRKPTANGVKDSVAIQEAPGAIVGHYRSFHYGDYRVDYRVFEDTRAVSVVGLGKKNKDHRTDLYKRLEDLAKRGRLADAVLETYRTISPEKAR